MGTHRYCIEATKPTPIYAPRGGNGAALAWATLVRTTMFAATPPQAGHEHLQGSHLCRVGERQSQIKRQPRIREATAGHGGRGP